jgi:hypothetical protein
MPDHPRELPHLYLRDNGKPETYTTKLRPPRRPLPQRERAGHAEALREALRVALTAAATQQAERDPTLLAGTPGFYLDFQFPAGSESAAELLESRLKHIELVAFRQPVAAGEATATVFVPDTQSEHFLKKVDQYEQENTRYGKPKGEALIARIDRVTIAAVRSLYTDDPELYPAPGEAIWWEIWLRADHTDSFRTVAERLDLPVQQTSLSFPDREVVLAYGDSAVIGRLFLNCDSVAELRRAKDLPGQFVTWSNVEQAHWANDLAARIVMPLTEDVAVCILDSGVSRAHPLLAPALTANDVQVYDPSWSSQDSLGHGTNMAGIALYGDLASALESSAQVPLTHRLESVKVLPDQGGNEPRLYGAITRDAIAQAEITAAYRKRAVCLAVTSDSDTNRGRPSSWSAAIDQLCFGDDDHKRLLLVSAGNIRDGISGAHYQARNEIAPIENPAQAWNAITVGAFTEKTTIGDPSFAGWEPLAPLGELCPTSRTSMIWERQWPIKPDILMEGGNWAVSSDDCDCPDDLGILTTFRDPSLRHFEIFRDTSAATAGAGHLAGQILAALPERWPESVRALMVHSAEWTPAMKQHFDAATSENQKRALLRKYGYGVANYDRAVLSANNDLTLIAEDQLQPFWKEDGSIKTRHMNLHQFPWPRTELEQLGATQVELRVTLSYYVEPNPGERGWLRKHRYASHALRFAVKRELESVDEFRRRINAAAEAEEAGLPPVPGGSDDWYLGRIRNTGSIHSDHWYGNAADLAKKSAIGVYPIGGWWKENPSHARYNQQVRYCLVVSIRAANGEVDIYTPVHTAIELAIAATTEI